MLGFKAMDSARAILGGIEMIHMMRKQQAKYACNQPLSLADQFERLAASILTGGHPPSLAQVRICDKTRKLRLTEEPRPRSINLNKYFDDECSLSFHTGYGRKSGPRDDFWEPVFNPRRQHITSDCKTIEQP
jgi:hypothetical protein